jgi:peptide/nickel transport system substrate-binding protein
MLQALGAGTAVGLAGCLGVFDSDDGEDVELLGPDGERVELALVYVQGTEAVATTAEYIAQELAGVGIEVGLESVSFDRLLQQYVRNRHVGEGEPEWTAGPNNAGPREETASERDWDLMFGITFNTYPRTPAATDAFWLERSPTNFYGYVPEADLASRFEAFRTTVEPNERRATIAEVFGILSEDQPVNFLSMSDDIGGYRRGVQGPVEEFGGNWDSTTWYIDEGAGRTVGERWIAGEASDAEGLYFPEITDGASSARVNLTLDGAYDVDENNEVRPLWMDITDTGDGQVYVCGLRDNLEWGDGYGQMTAEDWLYQIENVHTIDGGQDHPWDQDSPPSTQVADWAQIENVEQTGELEFQLELESVSPDFPLEPVLWGAYCAPAELYEEYVPDANALRTSDEFTQLTFTGNLGPYEFAGWERSAEFVATRNEDYYMREHAEEMGEEWADAPYFDRYSYRVIEEQATRLEALAGGEITATSIPPGRYHDFVENDEVDVYEVPQPFLTIVAYNQRANGWEELRTREVRQALSMAVDKRTVTEDIFRGLAEWTHTYQPRWSEWYDDERITEFGVDDSYDVEGARELLTEHTSEGYEYA